MNLFFSLSQTVEDERRGRIARLRKLIEDGHRPQGKYFFLINLNRQIIINLFFFSY